MKQQMKRLAAPKTWQIVRKGNQRWIAKPLPGTHDVEHCMPAITILRDMLKLANTNREAKQIVNNKQVLLNGVVLKDLRTGVGLFDILSIPNLNKNYRMIFTRKGKLAVVEVKDTEAHLLPLRVAGRTIISGGKQQVNFENGWNLLLKDKYVLNSTVLYDLKQAKPKEEIKIEKGAVVALIKGAHIGKLAKLEDIKLEGALRKHKIVTLKSLDGKEEWKTTAECMFAVGSKKPEFTAVIEK